MCRRPFIDDPLDFAQDRFTIDYFEDCRGPADLAMTGSIRFFDYALWAPLRMTV